MAVPGRQPRFVWLRDLWWLGGNSFGLWADRLWDARVLLALCCNASKKQLY